jgi:hypothetical protein
MSSMAADRVAEVLDRLLDPFGRALTPDAARRLSELRSDPAAQQRMDELADRCNEGLLTPEERAEYEAYVAAGALIAVLQAKARAAPAGGAAA